MKRLLTLVLALVCLLSLVGCRGGETVKVEYDEASLYTGSDIKISLISASPTTETVRFLVENGSGRVLTYGQPFITFSRKTPGGWKTIEPDPNWAYTAEGYILSPGDSVELEASTKRYLAGLRTDTKYRACFEFWYSETDPEADENIFQSTYKKAYLVYDFTLPDEVAEGYVEPEQEPAKGFDLQNDYSFVTYPGTPYAKDDITLNIISIDAEAGTLKLRVENSGEHTLYYGSPIFTFAVKSLNSFKALSSEFWSRQSVYFSETAILYELPPGEVLEETVAVDRYLEVLLPGYTYQVCFDFHYNTELPGAQGSDRLPTLQHYLVQEFEIGSETK